jgi:hypothetical protein
MCLRHLGFAHQDFESSADFGEILTLLSLLTLCFFKIRATSILLRLLKLYRNFKRYFDTYLLLAYPSVLETLGFSIC